MGTDVTQERQQAHVLVDLLPEEKLNAVVHLLQVITDPVARAIAHARVDEEPLTSDEIKALNESSEWLKHNEGIPHDQVLAELGITRDDIDRYNKAR
jgi:hypothetical protein